jgi:ankyrin repeat protein
MVRKLTPKSSLENLKREAKRWLKALEANDAEARARFERAHPSAPAQPTLRDVQLALAREHGLSGWSELKSLVEKHGVSTTSAALAEFLEAAGKGNVARVNSLLDANPELLDQRGDLNGSGLRTALHFGSGHIDVVRTLLERGADPNIRDEGDDAMPLHFVVERGDMAVTRLLVEHGADTVGDGTMHELNVLGWAICWDYVHNREVAEFLLTHGAKHTVHTAVALGDASALREIVTRSPSDVDKPMDRTNLRRRPVHLAVIKKQLGALEALVDLGADVDARDARGLTALDQAALNGEEAMVRFLLERGAKIGLPTAIALNRTQDLERLLQEDPRALARGGRWSNLIAHAAARAPGHVIEKLIESGADVNAGGDPETAVDQTHNYTPLHAAAWEGNTDAIAVLLRHGANVRARDSKYCGTPASWANYNNKPQARDLILAGPIDPFDAISHDRLDRLEAILESEPGALNRQFREYADCEPQGGHYTPLDFAIKAGKTDAERLLRRRGAISADAEHQARVEKFLRHACLDWRTGGSDRIVAQHTAERLLRQHPEIARENIYTAVAAGDLAVVNEILRQRPDSASEKGGPRDWPPLLYLGSARLETSTSTASTAANSAVIAKALLENGADPNAYYLGGNDDIHYTVLTAVMGEGEENAPQHPRARGLVDVLMRHGAEPFDGQVMYNTHFQGPPLWWFELMYEHSVRRGMKSAWEDPEWHMLDAGNYGCGARYVLGNAIEKNDVALVRWCLKHGAGPNPPPAKDKRLPATRQRSLYQGARLLGRDEIAELLRQYGAPTSETALDLPERFAATCMRMDRAEAKRLLQQHPELVHNHIAPHEAARLNRADVIAMLLDLGQSPNLEDSGGTVPLHTAAWANATEAATALIRGGADVDRRDRHHGATPLGWAVHGWRTHMMELLSFHSRDIWNIVFMGIVPRVRQLLREEPSLAKAVNGDGETLLMWLPDDEENAAELVDLLLEHGADPAHKDKNGLNAADHATNRALTEIAEVLRSGRRAPRRVEPEPSIVDLFLENACPDHHVRGGSDHIMARNTAMRLLRRHPEIARKSIYSAVVCGELEEVRRLLASRREVVREKRTLRGQSRAGSGGEGDRFTRSLGSKDWEPLLFLAFTRLDHEPTNENAVAIARALLDHGADPNAYFMAGGSRYTPLVGVIGEGEENRPAHPQRDALSRLFLERGANPYDIQVVYNIGFHGKVLWFLKLIHEFSVKAGRQEDWDDPNWSMLDMGGYGSGARWHLEMAIRENDLELAEWLLAHGASPNVAPARDARRPKMTLVEVAARNGQSDMAELLVRHGAKPFTVTPNDKDLFGSACFRLDRDTAQKLLRKHPEFLRETDVMVKAIKDDRADVAKLLLDLGMSPDVEDDTQQRALHVAGYEDAVQVARLLIERGAAIDPRESNWSNTPIDCAVYSQNPRMIDLLKPLTRDVWNLVWLGAVERLRQVVAEKPEVAKVTWNGWTPLMRLPDDETRAAEIVKLFLANGADPTITNEDGLTAADYAEKRALDEAARLLRPSEGST